MRFLDSSADTHQIFTRAAGYENWDHSGHFQQKILTFRPLAAEIGLLTFQKRSILGCFGTFFGLNTAQKRAKNTPKSAVFEMSGALSQPLVVEIARFFAQNVR